MRTYQIVTSYATQKAVEFQPWLSQNFVMQFSELTRLTKCIRYGTVLRKLLLVGNDVPAKECYIKENFL